MCDVVRRRKKLGDTNMLSFVNLLSLCLETIFYEVVYYSLTKLPDSSISVPLVFSQSFAIMFCSAVFLRYVIVGMVWSRGAILWHILYSDRYLFVVRTVCAVICGVSLACMWLIDVSLFNLAGVYIATMVSSMCVYVLFLQTLKERFASVKRTG